MRRPLLVVAASLAFAPARLAWADPPPAAPASAPASSAPARNCDVARANWNADPELETATVLARCQLRGGHPADAARTLSPYMQADNLSAAHATAVDVWNAARAQVLTVIVEVDVSGADVTVDGAPLGKSPLDGPLFLAPGRHEIAASEPASPPARRVVSGGAGQSASVVLRVVPLRADAIGYDEPTYELGARSNQRRTFAILGFSAAGVALVVGAVFTGLAVGKASSASDAQTSIRAAGGNDTSCASPVATTFTASCSALQTALGSRDNLANAALVSYLLAAAAAGGTLAYLFWPGNPHPAPWSPTVASVHASPVVGAGVGGMMLSGAF